MMLNFQERMIYSSFSLKTSQSGHTNARNVTMEPGVSGFMKTKFADFSEPWKWVPDLLELFKGSNVNCPVQGNSSLLIREEGVR